MNAPRSATLVAAVCLVFGLTAPVTAGMMTYVYDIQDEVGIAGVPMSTDGWAGDDLVNWQTANFLGEFYARNTNDGDDTIFRVNDSGFSFTIPADVEFVSLEIVARSPNFWQAGLSQGGSTRLGIGGDFGNNNKFFILDDFNRINEAGTNAVGDVLSTLRLDLDVINDTADLTLNNSILLIDDAAMPTLTLAGLLGSDGLFIRSDSRFAGPVRFTLTVSAPSIPEPSTAVLLGLSTMGVVYVGLRRRSGRRAGR